MLIMIEKIIKLQKSKKLIGGTFGRIKWTTQREKEKKNIMKKTKISFL